MDAKSHSDQIICPKCGFVQVRSEECARCGVVFKKYQKGIKRREKIEHGCGCIVIIALIVAAFLLLFKHCDSDEKPAISPAKVESGKQKEIVKHCESEADRKICNEVFNCTLYHKISNEEPLG